MIRTEAYILRSRAANPRGLELAEIELEPPKEHEVLVRPLYGSWEGNMSHAISRSPVDLCEARNENFVILGNSGVVEILETGRSVKSLKPGQKCLVFCNGAEDEHEYPVKIYGYDEPGSRGLLSKLTILRDRQLIPLASDSTGTLQQWAAFSLRYITAWANWRVAYGCWRTQLPEAAADKCFVLGWGGGVSYAELTLANTLHGCKTAMIASSAQRMALLERSKIHPIDRRIPLDGNLAHHLERKVDELTGGRGASILIDNIGVHFRITLRLLAREGVLTTSGWKMGATFPVLRSSECISRHIHVFTHYARYEEGLNAVRFAEEHGWLPPHSKHMSSWEDIPQLAERYAAGDIADYFPLYQINET